MTDRGTETANDDIRGGRSEAGYPEVGLLRSGSDAARTATLVAEQWALTASHCVAMADELVIGERPRRVERAWTHPSYRAEAPGSPLRGIDVAVVRLVDRVTDIRPAALSAVGDVATRSDLFVRSVGFGLDDHGASGTKRSAIEWVTQVDEENIATRGITGSTDRGDSGGPVFLGRSIVAVTSRGFGSSLSARVDSARAWLDATTDGAITWVTADVSADPDAPREVCEYAASRLCSGTSEEGSIARAVFASSCMESYTTCGQPPAFAACVAGALKCTDVARCTMLAKDACLSAVPPSTWAEAIRTNACDEYARARERCDGGRRAEHLADCARRFDACHGRLPAAVRCEVRDRQACAPSDCLDRPQCL